ncbi:MAG: exopolysaccharide biosynthesis polyprenyl glycosylphosphotransferase [Lachnospiraceae bacterium]|nr:exopolysaccharide biosynthesis polyprenyl glycosylphosphotransferase [Lachnospiraceae bacterium]
MKKLESFKRLIQLSLSGIGLAAQVVIFAHFYFKYYFEWIREIYVYYEKGHALMIAVYAFLLFMFSNTYGGTRIGYQRNVELIFSQIMGTFVTNVLAGAVIALMCRGRISTQELLLMSLIQLIVAGIWTLIASQIYKLVFPPRHLLLIHGDRPIQAIIHKLESRKDKYIVDSTININEGEDAVCDEALNGYDAVVIWDIPAKERNNILKFCYGKGVRVYIMPKISDVILAGAEMLHVFDTPILLTREYSLKFEQRAIKRAADFILSLLLIIITSPIMIITAIAVKLYDFGPVIYKQVRCTRGGKKFKILKFRSMRVDAEKDGVARLAKKKDDRITPIGRFIRKCRIDELPQLFNILAGDMSFIGPRPERPEIIAQYVKEMPEFAFRTKVKAGLAGYAQVYGKYNTTPYDKLKLDLCYIENYSVWLDLKLMLLTIKVLFWPDSTEGVGEGQITAMSESEAEEKND